MEKADELKGIHRSGTNIMSFFDDNDKEHELQKQQSAAEVKKDEYLIYFPLLKSREKLFEQESIWRKICEDLNWEFIQCI